MKRSVKCLTLEEKLRLIAEVEKSEKKKKDIAEQFGIPPSTLSTILKNKAALLEKASDYDGHSQRKRLTTCIYADVDEATIKWVNSARGRNIPLSGTIIREKAKEFAEALGHEDFSCSVGWLDKFKKRHNIVQKSICGESAAVDLQVRDIWQQNVFPDLIRNYDKDNIFNADETGVFFKCLPNKTLAFKNEKCFGGKSSKERITVMVGCNMTGSEKLKLLVIGKSKNPRCFKGIKSLDVDYEHNRKAWMTSEIYKKWLLNLDKKFGCQNRKILMFVDNCPAHPRNVGDKLKNIELAYFPPNMTSVLQPMDQGIIKNLKQHYRKRILTKVLASMEEDSEIKVTLLDAIRDLSKTWHVNVKTQTIANCFRKAGFIKEELPLEPWDDEDLLPLSELTSLWDSYCKKVTKMDGVTFEDYINIDEGTCTMDYPTEEDILESIIDSHLPKCTGKFENFPLYQGICSFFIFRIRGTR